MKQVFKFEFKHQMKAVLFWIMGMGCIQWIMMSVYPVFSENTSIQEEILANYPEELLRAFNMSHDLPLSSVAGYMVFTFTFVQLCFSIQSAYLGFSILSKEERAMTADFLLAKPVSRSQIFFGKLVASLLSFIITVLAVMGITLVTIEAYRGQATYDLSHFIILFAGMFFFMCLLFTIGLLASVFMRKVKNVLSLALALSLGTYVLNAVRTVVGGDLLGLFTPFFYFDIGYILKEGQLKTGLSLLALGMILTGLLLVYRQYDKRNIQSL